MPNPTHTISRTQTVFEEIQAVATPQHRSGGLNLDISDPIQWHPPPPGAVKVNVDTTFDPISPHVGLGVIVRNSEGVLLDGCVQSFCA